VTANVEFHLLEWTETGHLAHNKFVRRKGDKDPAKIVKET
jgi:hypothetical protein